MTALLAALCVLAGYFLSRIAGEKSVRAVWPYLRLSAVVIAMAVVLVVKYSGS